MIKINITDEQGTLLGQVELDLTDIHPRTQTLRAVDVGQAILDELPSNENALAVLLANGPDNPTPPNVLKGTPAT